MPITNRKLAQLAGVSPSTVSKVFAGSAEISEETAARVRKIAREYGWTPPKYRQNPGFSSHRHIALLIPELTSACYSAKASVAIQSLREMNIEPQIHVTGFEHEKIYSLIDYLIEDGVVDGIILIEACLYLKESPIPIIGVEPCFTEQRCPYDVVFSYSEGFGIQYVLDHLCSLGHKSIAFISEINTAVKLRLYKENMKKRGFSEEEIRSYVSDRRFEEIGCEAAQYYLQRLRDDPDFDFPTAFICAYDEIAFGMIRTFQNAGIRVPEQVSIVGCNDVPLAANAAVPLTTVRTFEEEQMQFAIQMLIRKIENPNLKIKQKIEFPCELIIRKSTAPPRTAALRPHFFPIPLHDFT